MPLTLHKPEHIELHSIADRVEIAPGIEMPRLGLGTSEAYAEEVEHAVTYALKLGYRLIDTATEYRNEGAIGDAIAMSGLLRAEVFLTSKVWGPDQGYESTLRACEASLNRLGVEYLDLYLIHWPKWPKSAETWRAFEELQQQGLVRAIGVSNFMQDDLERLMSTAQVKPAVNQFELHPWRQRARLQDLCRQLGITIEAWAPVMRGRANQVRELAAIGREYGKSGAQVSIRWILQKGIVTIPKSTHEERIRENMDVFDFELTDEEMRVVDGLDRDAHVK